MLADDPRHGTYAGTLAHRRAGVPACVPCQTAGRRTVKAAKMRLEKGIRNRVPLGRRAHDILTNVGPTPVAEATGLWRNNLYRAQRRGPEALVLRTTRDAILRVSGPTPVGVQRRIQALATIGHTLEVIADAAGVHHERLARIARSTTAPSRVTPRFAQGVASAYDQLRDQTPPRCRETTRRRTRSVQRGWLLPTVWDDIDDPNEDPLAEGDPDYLDPVLVQRIATGSFDLIAALPRTRDARTELCRAWVAAGRPLAELDRLSGWVTSRYFRISDQATAA